MKPTLVFSLMQQIISHIVLKNLWRKRLPKNLEPIQPRWLSGKNSPCQSKKMQETQVCSLSQEDLLVEETATHSSILAWKIPWTEEPGGLQSMWPQRVQHDWATVHAQLVIHRQNQQKNVINIFHQIWALLSVRYTWFYSHKERNNSSS